MSFDNFDILSNLKIDSISFSDGNIQIKSVDGKKYCIEPEGECCSSSWIEHIELPEPGETIIKIESIDLPAPVLKENECGLTIDEKGNAHDRLAFYFYRITTDKKTYDIEMRNSNNGYYGGWLSVR